MMPGTIRVSVLEIVMGLQSSLPLSQVSIKVSVGKKEYQTRVKGDLTFPLASLRDNLIIKILDAQGNEISQTAGVATRLIVEKGFWDDMYPLEGGGHVHMKLQFVLSEEEQDQVRAMRCTALRKKHGELMNSNLGSPDIATDVSSNVASSLCFEDETSDSQKSLLQSQAAATHAVLGPSCDNIFQNSTSRIKDGEGTRSVQEQMNTNGKDTNEETSSITSASVKKVKTLKASIDVAARAALGNSESLVTPQHNLTSSKLNEKPSPLEKGPSTVKNMISVFESNLVEDVKPRIRSPPTKLRASQDTMKSELLAPHTQTTAITADLKNRFKVKYKEIYTKEDNKSLIRASTSKTATASGRMLDQHSTRDQLANRQHYGDNLVRKGQGHYQKDLREVNTEGALHDKLRPEECWEDNYDCLEFSGAWMFRHNSRRLCITTAGKQMMHIMGGCCVETKTHLGEISSPIPENMEEEEVRNGTDSLANKCEKNSQNRRKSNPENSGDGEARRGPVRQVVRVAIMVGFAALVFFTRERRHR